MIAPTSFEPYDTEIHTIGNRTVVLSFTLKLGNVTFSEGLTRFVLPLFYVVVFYYMPFFIISNDTTIRLLRILSSFEDS